MERQDFLLIGLCSLATLFGCADPNSHPKNREGQGEKQENYRYPSQKEEIGNQNLQGNYPYASLQYNTKSIETIKGRLVAMMKMELGGQSQVQWIVRTEKGEIPVLIGPEWYVQDGLAWMQAGDEIEVKGSIIYVNGRIFMIASDVRTRDYDLKLRDSAGMPLWSGWRKR